MACGWFLNLDAYAYLLLGIPLCLLFQLFVSRTPLSSAWVRDTTAIRLDLPGIGLALALAIVPLWYLIQEWPGGNWCLRLYFILSLFGAAGVAFAVRKSTAATVRSLLLCLATAGTLGCALVLVVALTRNRSLAPTFALARFAIEQFLVLLPVQFVMEEVAFRGVLDTHVHHQQDSRPLTSALFLSAMWGWWHLPITAPAAMSAGLIAFPITHALIGVPLSMCWRRSGNLIVPATVHALINAFRNACA
jgi:membrane protease YdiL (CAAX protease family)